MIIDPIDNNPPVSQPEPITGPDVGSQVCNPHIPGSCDIYTHGGGGGGCSSTGQSKSAGLTPG